MVPHPFNLDEDDAYRRWRDRKLETAPTTLADVVVEIGDPRGLRDIERQAMLDRCRRANMAIYIGSTGNQAHKAIPVTMGAHFGLNRLDHNRGADDDAITSLTVQTDAAHRHYIPYNNLPIGWHTDGYYNPASHQIHGLLLHCVQPAESGGENALLDHEIAYMLVRDRNPEHIRALMHPSCMTIPAHAIDGVEVRAEQAGPVFSVGPNGHLHMRYTDRSRHIVWRDDPSTADAVSCLKDVLRTPSPWHLKGRLEAGWGLISNNVLHTRTGFTDGPVPRLLYRARYYDRIDGT
jgi:hypothetical protein